MFIKRKTSTYNLSTVHNFRPRFTIPVEFWLFFHEPHLTVAVNLTPVFRIRGRCGELDMTGCFSTTRALQGNNTAKHVNNMTVCVCVLVCVSVLHDAMSHFDRSFVYKDSVKFSISARGAGELEALVLLYFWFCSFCSCSRTCCSTSATVVNLNVKKNTS